MASAGIWDYTLCDDMAMNGHYGTGVSRRMGSGTVYAHVKDTQLDAA